MLWFKKAESFNVNFNFLRRINKAPKWGDVPRDFGTIRTLQSLPQQNNYISAVSVNQECKKFELCSQYLQTMWSRSLPNFIISFADISSKSLSALSTKAHNFAFWQSIYKVCSFHIINSFTWRSNGTADTVKLPTTAIVLKAFVLKLLNEMLAQPSTRVLPFINFITLTT